MWNNFIEKSNNGTIFHKLEFLAYHKNRFKEDEHHLILFKGESIYAVFPMAVFIKDNKKLAMSPYGASYGGPVFSKPLNYHESKLIVSILVEYFVKQAFNEVIITFPIRIVDSIYSETFFLALLENNFRITNSDISSTVSLEETNIELNTFTSRARNMAKKARKVGAEIQLQADTNDFWVVMEKTFKKLGRKPTHTLKEWKWLCDHLPGQVWCDVAFLEGKPVAGIGHFRINSRVDSSFYLCSDPEYQKTQVLSLLIYESILNSQREEYKYFDFGTSSTNMKGNEGIFQFKESFGAVGMVRNTFTWKYSE